MDSDKLTTDQAAQMHLFSNQRGAHMTPFAVSAWTFITSHAKAEWERHREQTPKNDERIHGRKPGDP
jgi:hypothetical protein